MSVGNRLRSRVIRAMISPQARQRRRAWHEARRKLAGRRHTVSVFLQLDDPYSYLLSAYLRPLAEHYDIELRVWLSQALGGDFQPMPDMHAEYALVDCRRLAAELGLPFLDKGDAPPVVHCDGLLEAMAVRAGDDGFGDELIDALRIYWRGDHEAAARLASAGTSGSTAPVIARSQERLRKLGHYGSAMLHYGGEWYWGVDRLHYLTERLDELDVARQGDGNARLASIRQAMQLNLPFAPPAAAAKLPALELFYSFRSPYSQLCLRRVFDLADAFGLQLVLRPVLPMVMRGLPLPKAKAKYIIADAAREAETHGVRFGEIADPLGRGVERCHAVFAYAESEHRGRDFLLNAGELIWGRAVDVATDEGLRKLTGKTGLFWPEVVEALSGDDWRDTAKANREYMQSLGSWGVPSMCIGDYTVWGQDRVWLLARHLEELCDTGEGILV